MTLSTEIATPHQSTKSRHSHSSAQVQMKPKSQFESVPRDAEKSEFFDLVDFGNVAFSVDTVICVTRTKLIRKRAHIVVAKQRTGPTNHRISKCISFKKAQSLPQKSPILIGLFWHKRHDLHEGFRSVRANVVGGGKIE